MKDESVTMSSSRSNRSTAALRSSRYYTTIQFQSFQTFQSFKSFNKLTSAGMWPRTFSSGFLSAAITRPWLSHGTRAGRFHDG
jgi:hypothetical protein